MVYHDLVNYALKYLAPEDVAAVLFAASRFSEELSGGGTPDVPAIGTGAAQGALGQLCASILRDHASYITQCARRKIARNGHSLAMLSRLSYQDLHQRGYSDLDISVIIDATADLDSVEEFRKRSACCDTVSQHVTNQAEGEPEPEQELERNNSVCVKQISQADYNTAKEHFGFVAADEARKRCEARGITDSAYYQKAAANYAAEHPQAKRGGAGQERPTSELEAWENPAMKEILYGNPEHAVYREEKGQ